MLKEALEEVLIKGEKLRQEVMEDILDNQVFKDLANNPRFVKAVARVIRSKDEVTRSVANVVKEALTKMNLANREQIKAFDRRVNRLEKDLDVVSRRILAKMTGQKPAAKPTAKATTTKKKATPKKATPKKAAKKKAAKKTTKKVAKKAVKKATKKAVKKAVKKTTKKKAAKKVAKKKTATKKAAKKSTRKSKR